MNEKDGSPIRRVYILQEIIEEPFPIGKRFSKAHLHENDSSTISISDLFKLVKQYDKEFNLIEVHPSMLNKDGTTKVFYHQTENDFTVFDTQRKGAGSRDLETPYGIFLKESIKDIGLKDKKQVALYANIKNPLTVENRGELVLRLARMSNEYSRLKNISEQIDEEHKAKSEAAASVFKSYVKEELQNHLINR